MTAEATGDAWEAITAATREFTSAFARGDAAGMAALYTVSGQLLPANSDVVAGTQAIRAFWQVGIDVGFKELIPETRELELYGDVAHEVGRYRLRASGGELVDQGKYLVIWKREGGQWKMHRHIANSSLPAA